MTVRPYVRTSVRPSAPQGHQYTSYTGYNPVLNPMCLARNRMLIRVVAKQAKTTKVKNKFVNGKEQFKRIFSCLFGGRRKVQFNEWFNSTCCHPPRAYPRGLEIFSHLAVYSPPQSKQKETIPHPRDSLSAINRLFCVQNRDNNIGFRTIAKPDVF